MSLSAGSNGGSISIPTPSVSGLSGALESSLVDGIGDVSGTTWDVANVSTGVENRDWILIVDATILSLTILGAMMIILSMAFLEWRGRPSTTRMRLVQSLVVSDLSLGITGLIGVSLALQPEGLKPGQACDGLGVVIVAILWSEHLWTMSLAIATFMILIHPLHPFTLYLEKKWWHSWVLVWVISFAISVGGYVAYGVAPSGGICYYPAATAPLYGPLMQFIPRAVVFIVITLLYARLFVFLRRPDKIRSPYSNSPIGSMTDQQRSRTMSSSFRPIGVISTFFRKAPPKDYHKEHVLERRISIAAPAPDANRPEEEQNANLISVNTPPLASPTSEVPPWERVELPVFQVDGQRFGGTTGSVSQSGSSSHLWGNWKGLGGGSQREGRKRFSMASSSSPPTQSSRRFGSGSSLDFNVTQPSPPSLASPRLEPIPSMLDPLTPEENEAQAPTPMQSQLFGARGSWSASTAPSDRFRNFSLRSDTLVPGNSLSTMTTDTDRRPSGGTSDSRRSSGAMIAKKDYAMANFPPSLMSENIDRDSPAGSRRGSAQRGSIANPTSDEEEEDEDMDLMRMLQQSAPPNDNRDRFAPAEGETIELVEESMASYLNRKTALLMLWFPLGYILLFSVSLIRVIYDFAGRPPVALRAVSRWFIFAQGILDALIYGLVEWHTKRVIRKRVKKGTFSQPRSTGSTSWPRALRVKRGQASGSNLATNSGNGTGSNNGTGSRRDPKMSSISRQAVTFGRVEERSILRELDLLGEKGTPILPLTDSRRGSGKDSVDTKATSTSGMTAASVGTGTSGGVTDNTTGSNGKQVKVPG